MISRMKTGKTRSIPQDVKRRLGLLLLIGVTAGLSGCTRAFFRQWANQDAAEAVFEKSRDPRWRIDMFSIDPPQMSRFADPYDPDHPPAPPDDYATQALSPVPQWPQNRLIAPVEGTGYEDMLIRFNKKREDEQQAQKAAEAAERARNAPRDDSNTPRPPGANPPPSNPAPGEPSPFKPAAPSANLGPNPEELSPKFLDAEARSKRLPQKIAEGLAKLEAIKREEQLLLAAYKRLGIEPPKESPAPRDRAVSRTQQVLPTGPIVRPGAPQRRRRPGEEFRQTAPPFDPNPNVDEATRPEGKPPGMSEKTHEAIEEITSEMAAILSPGSITMTEAFAAGLPEGYKPYVVNLEQTYQLAMTNARAYQYQLETVYEAALAVALQRFAFEPQFYAGMSPTQGAGGIPQTGGAFAGGVNPANIFSYRTKYAPGGQLSGLNMGTVAGVGKLFSSGGQLITGFANQLVFNFVGKNAAQPTVQSQLPLTFVQPFLAGGGRAVTLENLTQAERQLIYTIRLFARFRQEFFTSIAVGTPITNPGLFDPDPGFIQVLQSLIVVEISMYNLAAFEQILKVFKELAKGESSGLTPLQVDQAESQVQSARATLISNQLAYRNNLDQMKVQLGLPPDIPMTLDLTLLSDFRDAYDAINRWQANPRRKLAELESLVEKVPDLQEIEIDNRGVISSMYDNEGYYTQENLEDLLLAAERIALENRLDLMNSRAQLYDAWRQLRVTANALKGVLNVTLTNQYLTPTPTTNPFGFIDQAKQFSLVLNTELPLVRISQRNNFRTAWINFQRQRRTLMQAEDQIKYGIRTEVRQLQVLYATYKIQKQVFVLVLRQKDQAQEQIVAPPPVGAAVNSASAAAQTINLISFQSSIFSSQGNLIANWINYQLYRLQLFRDLGTMPYDEWEAFYELFPPKARNGGPPRVAVDRRPPRAEPTATR